MLYDFKGAFDCVWHDGLIYKMIKIEIPLYLINIVKDYLHGRTFSVRVGSFETKKFPVGQSVPQGGVLSPTLFLIFINDLPMSYKKDKNYTLLFADDVQWMAFYRKSLDRVGKLAQKYNKSLEEWSDQWRMTFAPSKCSYTVFTKGKRNAAEQVFDLKLYGEPIPKDNAPKFLGFRFDPELSGKNQVAYIRQAGLKRLGIIKQLAHKSWQLSKQTLVQIYMALIRSLFNYSCFAINLMSETNKKKLQALENSALRAIYHEPKHFNNEKLLELANMDGLNVRLNKLTSSYFNRCDTVKNPLICDLIADYKDFVTKDETGRNTLLCMDKYTQEMLDESNESN